MVPVLSRDCGGQPQDELRFRPADDLLETQGGQMVTVPNMRED